MRQEEDKSKSPGQDRHRETHRRVSQSPAHRRDPAHAANHRQVSPVDPEHRDQAQKRLIAASYPLPEGSIRVVNGYFPQGESRDHPVKFPNKARFYADLYDDLNSRRSPAEWLLVVGDMNVAPQDLDIGIGDENVKRWLRTGKCSFLPEERQWLQRLCEWGLIDTFRACHPQTSDRFSWFDYRSRGFEANPPRGLRIDLVLASAPLADCCVAAGIDYDIRAMQKPSDHAPVWAEFKL